MKLKNISFVVIAHNEEFGLTKCLRSISQFDLENCEVLCVDSGSVDKTQEVARSFTNLIEALKIIEVSGYQNAAIARNAGLKYATKDFVYFVDGDVELNEYFIVSALNAILTGDADAVVGILEEFQYDPGFERIVKTVTNRTSLFKKEYRYLCGGIFIVKKDVIDKIGLFNEKFEKSQDYEFTLRLTKNYKLLAIPVSMGIHHTIPYSNKDRMENEIKNRLPIYYGMAIRNNINNFRGCIDYIHRIGYFKSIIVIILLPLSFFFNLAIVFFILSLLIDVLAGIRKKQNVKHRIISHYVYPFFMLYGFYFDINQDIYSDTKIKLIK